MTKVITKKVKCIKCGEESEQFVVCSVNFMLGDKNKNDELIKHKQKCPNCNYTAEDISR